MGIKFNVTQRQPGKIDIYFNKKLVYSGIPSNEVKIQIPMDEVSIYSKNDFEIIAEKGADYKISNLTVYLFSGASPTLDKTYYFEPINQSVKVGIKVRIFAPGMLAISLIPQKTVFFINKGMVSNNDWNWFTIDEKFMEHARGITVYSPNGKFEIDGFMIIPR